MTVAAFVSIELAAIIVVSLHTAGSYSAIIFSQLLKAEHQQLQDYPCSRGSSDREGYLVLVEHGGACSLTMVVIQEPAYQVTPAAGL